MTAEDIAKALYACSFRFKDEKEFQAGISQALVAMGVEFKPEVILTMRDRIDFLCAGGVGIEAKTYDASGGVSLSAVTRQLFRYAQRPEITSLILITTRSKHRNLPPPVLLAR